MRPRDAAARQGWTRRLLSGHPWGARSEKAGLKTNSMVIAQISDTHILARSSDQAVAAPRAENLRRCVADINRQGVDVVVHTGDIVHHGLAEEYAHLGEILADLEAPLLLIPGNRDRHHEAPRIYTHQARRLDRDREHQRDRRVVMQHFGEQKCRQINRRECHHRTEVAGARRDHIGDREGLAAAGDPQQGLMPLPVGKTGQHRLDGCRLIARGLERTPEIEKLRHAHHPPRAS